MKYKGIVLAGVMMGVLTGAGSTVGAVALSQPVIEKYRQEGKLDAWVERMNMLRATGMDQPLAIEKSGATALAANASSDRVPVLLIDFRDLYWNSGYARQSTPAAFDSLLFSIGKNPTGSMKEYYLENSYGQYTVDGQAIGWYRTMWNRQSYNGIFEDEDDANLLPSDLAYAAVTKADNDIDFSDFDLDGDGYLNSIIIIHAGTGYEESGDSLDIWSHSQQVYFHTADGVIIRNYTMQPEESQNAQSMSAIGVFCHEWGHAIGLPDLYDIDYSSEGVGRWSLMGSGSYNGQSKRPAQLDAWCKHYLGWLTLTSVTANATNVTIPAVEFDPTAFRLQKPGPTSTEYFIVENRSSAGFDDNLPGYGLVVYHIDETIAYNNNDWRPKVFVEQADGKFDLQDRANQGDNGDPYPGVMGVRAFTDMTVPGSRLYSNASSQIGLWNISDAGANMTADFDVTFSRPYLRLNSVLFSDQAYGNGDSKLEAGEKIQVSLSVTNIWAAAQGIAVTIAADDSNLSVEIPSSTLGDLGTGATGNNLTMPFEFQIPAEVTPRIDSFFFHITANSGAYDTIVAAEAFIGRAQALIVDDDNGDSLESCLTAPLYHWRMPYDIWRKKTQGSPSGDDLGGYHAVLWLTGDVRQNLLTADDITAMKLYMINGGNLFLTGQGLAAQLSSQDPELLEGYFKCEFLETRSFIPVLKSDTAATILAGFSLPVIVSGYGGASNQTATDIVWPLSEGVPELYFLDLAHPTQVSPNKGAVSYSGSYKSVFFSFGFEAILADDPDRVDRDTVFQRIMDFFGDLPTDVADGTGGLAALPNTIRLDQNFPNPFNPATKISYRISGDDGPRIDRTRLEILNILGQRIAMPVDRDEAPGQYSVIWDGRDEEGRAVASGVYLYRLSRGALVATQKMILLK